VLDQKTSPSICVYLRLSAVKKKAINEPQRHRGHRGKRKKSAIFGDLPFVYLWLLIKKNPIHLRY